MSEFNRVAMIVEAFAAIGYKVTATHESKTVRVMDENVEGGYYEYLDSDVTITLEDGTTYKGNGIIETMATAIKSIMLKEEATNA